MNIALIDYGAGNLRSVANTLTFLKLPFQIVSQPSELANATHIVLPGVGSFGDSMAQLAQRNLIEPLREWILAGKPYFGICLGYQILFESSEECPGVEGLGIFQGEVTQFARTPGLKIPHMGWNSASLAQPERAIWNELGTEPYFYYVHSFFPNPSDASIIAAKTDYEGQTFAAAIQQGAIFACQFHPEKSQDSGLQLIANFFKSN